MSQSALQPRRKILFTFPNLLLVSLIRRTEQKPVGKELKNAVCSISAPSSYRKEIKWLEEVGEAESRLFGNLGK